jgi:hypothetical protein
LLAVDEGRHSLTANVRRAEAKALATAESAEKRAKDAYAKALQQEQKESPRGIDTRTETFNRD